MNIKEKKIESKIKRSIILISVNQLIKSIMLFDLNTFRNKLNIE